MVYNIYKYVLMHDSSSIIFRRLSGYQVVNLFHAW